MGTPHRERGRYASLSGYRTITGDAADTFRLTVVDVHGDVELTHLRQFGLTHLFQVARSWRAPSSLVDADRGLCHLV